MLMVIILLVYTLVHKLTSYHKFVFLQIMVIFLLELYCIGNAHHGYPFSGVARGSNMHSYMCSARKFSLRGNYSIAVYIRTVYSFAHGHA